MSSGSETFVADSQSSFHGPTSNTSYDSSPSLSHLRSNSGHRPRRNEHVLRLLRHLQAEQDKQRDLLKEVRELTIQCLREHNKEAVQMRNVIEELGVKQGTVITTPSIEIETTSDSFTKAADETQRFKERTVLTRWWTTFVFWIQGLFVFQNWKAAFSQPSPPAGVKPALDRPQEVSNENLAESSTKILANAI